MFQFRLSSVLVGSIIVSIGLAFLHDQSVAIVGSMFFLGISLITLPGLIVHCSKTAIKAIATSITEQSLGRLVERGKLVLLDATWLLGIVVTASTTNFLLQWGEPKIVTLTIAFLISGPVLSIWGYCKWFLPDANRPGETH